MKKTLEIRAAEGGDDSKLFVEDLATAYEKTFQKLGWKSQRLSLRPGFISIEITGKKLDCLVNEAGGHRVQRIPPTERKGRVHTSTVTVAITDSSVQTDSTYDMISDNDFRIEWFSGTGAGGQHRNKTQNCCRVIHIPTGLVESRQGRKREGNLRDAKQAVLKLLQFKKDSDSSDIISQDRKQQVGSGMRGDKIRTYRFQEDRVTDHQSGRSQSIKKVMRGGMNIFWE